MRAHDIKSDDSLTLWITSNLFSTSQGLKCSWKW